MGIHSMMLISFRIYEASRAVIRPYPLRQSTTSSPNSLSFFCPVLPPLQALVVLWMLVKLEALQVAGELEGIVGELMATVSVEFHR